MLSGACVVEIASESTSELFFYMPQGYFDCLILLNVCEYFEV